MLGGTLLTFLELNGNASSAAAALGVTRHTVAGRVRMVEERLGRPLGSCAAQLETALRIAELEVGDSPPSGR
jgi:DNA-binding PucR family transcriptional regulator